jgi:hypothetical protein
MAFGRNQPNVATIPVTDPTGWLLDSDFAEFLLLHKVEIKYMAMLGYTFLHGMTYCVTDVVLLESLTI